MAFIGALRRRRKIPNVKGGLLADNAYSATLTGLSPETQYWYKACLKVDNQTFYGEVKSLTTVWIPVEEVALDKSEYAFHTIGSTLTLIPTVSPSDASDKGVSWKSSDESVATVAQWVTSITLSQTSLSLLAGADATLSVKSILPSNAVDKSYVWSSSNDAVASVDESGKVTARSKGTATIKATAKDGSGAYGGCSVEVCRIDTPEAVDLGLSVKWGSFNLGASAPKEYGLYYAWGEIESKQDFYWSNYKWCKGSERSLIKYNSDLDYGPVPIDSKMILDTQDDVARTKLGSDWRMPYIGEWNELINNCTWQWTRLNGVIGYKITSKKSGYTDRWIFLPAAGYWDGSILYHSGSQGLYWSLNRSNTSYMGRCMVCYYSWGQDYCSAADVSRNRGQSIRPVLP